MAEIEIKTHLLQMGCRGLRYISSIVYSWRTPQHIYCANVDVFRSLSTSVNRLSDSTMGVCATSQVNLFEHTMIDENLFGNGQK